MIAWVITLFAFFFLAIQLFVTIIEFKLTTLAGFILIPFALWNKTSFLAEKVLGNVVSSGIKLMVLAIIVGIGSTIFGEITSAFVPGEVELKDAASVILGSLAILALGLFGPGIATGLVSGAPQLGAGAAVGTMAAVGAGALAGGAMASAGAKGAASAWRNVRGQERRGYGVQSRRRDFNSSYTRHARRTSRALNRDEAYAKAGWREQRTTQLGQESPPSTKDAQCRAHSQ